MRDHALVIGEALVDVVDGPEGRSAHPGGSPANVAIGLARLGRPVELLTSLGADAEGDMVRRHIEASGATIASSGAARRTSVATATVDDKGVAAYEFDIEWSLAGAAGTSPDPLVVHTGSIAAVLEPGASVVESLLTQARPRSTVTYDPNVRPSLMGDRDRALATIERFVRLADVVKVSDEDLEWLLPGVDPADAARSWLGQGPSLVVVTLGAKGALGCCAAGTAASLPVTVKVADTVGAGDSFMAGLIDGLWTAGLVGAPARERLAAIDLDTLRSILERCARAAAITVSRTGANPPTASELNLV